TVELLKLGALGHDIFNCNAIWSIVFTRGIDVLSGLVTSAWYEYRGGNDVQPFPRTINDCARAQIAGPERFDLCGGVAFRSAWRDGKGLSIDIDAVVVGNRSRRECLRLSHRQS